MSLSPHRAHAPFDSMAHIHPTGWREMSITSTAAREIETLAYLEASLANAPYSNYHGVHWTNVEQGFSAYGEIDFIIVAPSGRVLLIEQKSAASPFEGADIEALVYPEGDTDAMLAPTQHAITLGLAAGFARQDIAIASFTGREKSAILGRDTLGEAHTLKSFVRPAGSES